MKLLPYDHDIPAGHPAQERRNGFKIHARPRTGEPLWSLDGRIYTQTAALAMCFED